MIVVDSCIWIDFLSGRDERGLGQFLVDGHVTVCGTILAEVLSGVRSPPQAKILRKMFLALPYLEEGREVFLRAAELFAQARTAGTRVPLSDCVIASVCLCNSLPLLTNDKHFSRFKDLVLTVPGEDRPG